MEKPSSYPKQQQIKEEEEEKDEELLKLSLSTGSRPQPSISKSSPLLLGQPSGPPFQLFSPSPQPEPPFVYMLPPSPIDTSHHHHHQEDVTGSSRSLTRKSSSKNILKEGKGETIPAPYPWATNRRATVHSLEYLIANGLNIISGQVQCKKCEKQYEIEIDLQQKFKEVASFVLENKCTMHDRAPSVWLNPILPDCSSCNQTNCVKPIMNKKRSTNWLFLLLAQMLGCCQLKVLKYFCKHTKNHRTGAKDRLLYLTYLELCKQLDPSGPFDV